MASSACFQSTSRAVSCFRVSWHARCRLCGARRANFDATRSRRRLTQSAAYAGARDDVGFLLDIDGVLLGEGVGSKGKQAIRRLQDERIPFVLLTNGGGICTADRTRLLSEQLEADPPLNVANVVQAHTPMVEALYPLRKKRVYMVGGKVGAWQKIAEELQLEKVDNVDTLTSMRPEIWPFRDPPTTRRSQWHEQEPFAGIVVVHDSRDWGADIQIMCDLLGSKDGTLGGERKDRWDDNVWTRQAQMPLYFSNNDFQWKSNFPLPRFGQGAFRIAFESVCGHTIGRVPHSTVFGKPGLETFRHAIALLHKEAKRLDKQPSARIIMVGDNPDSDIAGANQASILSVLVRTGVFSGTRKPDHQPSVITDDVLGAIQWAVESEAALSTQKQYHHIP